MIVSNLLSLRTIARTSLGFAVVNGAALEAVNAQTAAGDAAHEVPEVSVEGSQGGGGGGYEASDPNFGKMTGTIIDTPHSITQVTKQLMDDQGVTTFRDALRMVPGVSIAAGEAAQNGDNLSIRGFNAQNDLFLDDVRDFGSYYRDPFNLETIEVMKGPASVMFGRGSSGGAVNQVSKSPQLAPISAGTLSFGTDGTARITADVNRKLEGIDNAAIRLNVMVNRNGVAGRGDNSVNRRFGFAPEVTFGIGTDTRLSLKYYHFQEYDTPDYGIPWLNGKPAPVSSSNFYGNKDADFFRTNVDIGTIKLEHDFNEHITVNNQLRYGNYLRMIRVTEPLITGQGPGQDVVFPGTALSSILVSKHVIYTSSRESILNDQTNATLHFNTGWITHTAVAGIEVARQTSDPTRLNYPQLTVNMVNPGPAPAFTAPSTFTSFAGSVINNYGIYAIDTIGFGPHFDVIVGWRWDRFDSTFHQNLVSPALPTINKTRNDDLPTYHAALVYKPTPDGSIYFDYGTSFDPSAESLSLSAATATAAPEKTTIYEVGTKWNVLHQRLTLTAAAYLMDKANAREVDPNNPLQDILAGHYRMRGIELGATGKLTDKWSIFGGYSYNDAEVVASPNPAEVGHAPPNAPRHTLSVWTEYHTPWYGIEVGGGLSYVSARTASSLPVTGTNVIEIAPGYWTMQLMAKYPIRPGLSAQVNVTNVTDTLYYDQLHPGHIILGASRAALFTLNAKF